MAFSIAGLILIVEPKDIFPVLTCTLLSIIGIILMPSNHRIDDVASGMFLGAALGWFAGVILNHRKDILRPLTTDEVTLIDSDPPTDVD